MDYSLASGLALVSAIGLRMLVNEPGLLETTVAFGVTYVLAVAALRIALRGYSRSSFIRTRTIEVVERVDHIPDAGS